MGGSQRDTRMKVMVLVIGGGLWLPHAAAAQTPAAKVTSPPAQSSTKVKNYDEVFQRYLESARNMPAPQGIWMADLTTDPNARRVNDLVTVRVVESLTATGSADTAVDKNSSANVKLPLPKSWIDMSLGRIVPMSAETTHKGSGSTTRTSELTATLTARVVDVLPNGDLVVEGVREVNINGDRSVVVLSGVIRPFDVLPGNVVPSTRIGQLSISSLSQGLIKDSLTPGYLIRLLNKVF